ncbi:MAG: AAA family ATPase [Elusimicrobia bacterium]|nr:AAA family ATPase [Elusimicrobiota bacterium]
MYLEHWQLREKPFENTADPRFLFRSGAHEEALNRLLYAVREKKGAAMLSGVFGCGKTLMAETLKMELSSGGRYKTAFIFNPLLSNVEILREIVFQLGVRDHLPKEKTELLHVLGDLLLQNANDGKNTVVIIDEAHVIDERIIFEELRLLLNFQKQNMFLLTLLLIGQPELKEKVNQIKQLQQRIAVSYYLDRLNPEETRQYISHRVRTAGQNDPIFTPEAVQLVTEHSGGIPRRINHLCDLALMAGFGKGARTIDKDIVQDIAKDLEL